MISDCAPSPARTRPPLSAVPGGVTSFQVLLPAGRTNSCQKLFSVAAEPPMTTTAHVPAAVVREVARNGVPAGRGFGRGPGRGGSGAAAPGQERRHDQRQRGGRARFHECPSSCCAASVSSAANDDLVACVPGPVSKSSSWRMWPVWSMTNA